MIAVLSLVFKVVPPRRGKDGRREDVATSAYTNAALLVSYKDGLCASSALGGWPEVYGGRLLGSFSPTLFDRVQYRIFKEKSERI